MARGPRSEDRSSDGAKWEPGGVSRDALSLQPEIFAEINASYVFIIDDLVGFAEGEHQSVVDDVGVVANPQRFPNVMVRDEDADAAFLEKADDFLNVEYRNWVDAREGFIEQYETRTRRERPGDLDATALAAGQRQCGGLPEMRDIEIAQQPGKARLDLLLGKFLQLQHRADVLFDGQLAEHGGFLGQVRYSHAGAAMHREMADFPAVEMDRSVVHGDQSYDHVKASRLPGAVRTQKPHDLTARHLKRHVLDYDS